MSAWRTCIITLLGLVTAAESRALEATYTVRLETLWNQTDHLNNYPANAHFSPLIGAVHSNNVSFWAPGQLASFGIERVAELGSTSVFRNEINASITSGETIGLIENGQNVFSGDSALTNEFTIQSGYPLVTLATMVAPSSDWFIGVHDLDLREDGVFVEELVIEFDRFYDAGTEEGALFNLSNPSTVPREPIRLVSGTEAAAPFHGAGASTLEPIARFTFTRQSLIGLPGDYNGDGNVTTADYQAWRQAHGATGDHPADGNGDGRVDAADYTVWRDAYVPNQSQAVPEPSAAVVLIAGLLSAMTRGRRFR